MESHQNAPVHYVESKSCRAPNQVGSLLFEMLCSQQKDFQEVVFLSALEVTGLQETALVR